MTVQLGAGVPAGKPALLMGGSGSRWTFAELQQRIDEACCACLTRTGDAST